MRADSSWLRLPFRELTGRQSGGVACSIRAPDELYRLHFLCFASLVGVRKSGKCRSKLQVAKNLVRRLIPLDARPCRSQGPHCRFDGAASSSVRSCKDECKSRESLCSRIIATDATRQPVYEASCIHRLSSRKRGEGCRCCRIFFLTVQRPFSGKMFGRAAQPDQTRTS